MYVIGKTGMGKSTLLENMAIQDIQNGEGIAFIDPHGSTAEKLLDFIPQDRIKDVVYFAPFDIDYPDRLQRDGGRRLRQAPPRGLRPHGRLQEDLGGRVERAHGVHSAKHAARALGVSRTRRCSTSTACSPTKTFRNKVVENITDPIVKAFWTEEFANYTDTLHAGSDAGDPEQDRAIHRQSAHPQHHRPGEIHRSICAK